MKGSNSVFDTILEAGENKVTLFCDNLSTVFSHAKNEILDFIEKWDNGLLLSLRSVLFSKTLVFLPQYNGSELFARRNKTLLLEDIYVIGYSVVNKREHKCLRKILKKDGANESLASEAEHPELLDKNDLFETCVELREIVDILKIRINGLDKKVDALEDEVTTLKLTIHNLNESQSSSATDDSSSINAEDGRIDAASGELLEIGTQTEGNPLECNKAIQNKIIRKPTKSPEPSEDASEDAAMVLRNKSPVNGFRHTQSFRRKLLNGSEHRTNPSSYKSNMFGTSTTQHRVTSITSSQDGVRPKQQTTSEQLCLVYVGRLTHTTTEDDLRAHLIDSGVSNDNIADVMKLRSRSTRESSFCVSLSNTEAESMIYVPSKWPEGTRIRPFKQKSPKRQQTYNKSQFHSKPPRFRDTTRQRPIRPANSQWYPNHQEHYQRKWFLNEDNDRFMYRDYDTYYGNYDYSDTDNTFW